MTWDQPVAAAAQDRAELAKVGRSLLRTWFVGFGLLAPPTLWWIWDLAPDRFPRALGGLAMITVGLPLLTAIRVYLAMRSPAIYEIGPRGLRYRGGGGHRIAYPWRTIHACEIVDHPDMPGLRALRFRSSQSRADRLWVFDPGVLDERLLERAVGEGQKTARDPAWR